MAARNIRRHLVWALVLSVFACAVLSEGPARGADEPAAAFEPSGREAELEARLRQVEEANRLLADQMRALTEELRAIRQEARPPAAAPPATRAAGPASRSGDTPGTSTDPAAPTYEPTGTRREPDVSLRGKYGEGYQFSSEDSEFQLNLHLETQLDYRQFSREESQLTPDDDVFARSGFYTPRTRLIFTGRITKPFEYAFSINRGFGQFDLLDAFVNLRYSDKLQVRLGRFQTPWNYEQFAVQNMWLITPERSLFTANLGLNRMLGAMIWGQTARDRVDYAVGGFNGPRNSFDDFNNGKDILTYLNVRPFQEADEDWPLRNLNLGGSFSYGAQDNELVPRAFRTATNASNAGTADRAAPPFLLFRDGVLERGQRTFWSGHLAYFYKQLSILADYNGGILRYVRDDTARASAVLPVSGYSVALGYFLTGETLERRTLVEPLRPFSLKRGRFSPGAVELTARYSTFYVDPQVFEAGLSEPENWSNDAWTSTLGLNWYLNRNVKIYLDWQHAEYGSPVLYALPASRALTNELFWFRFQFYF